MMFTARACQGQSCLNQPMRAAYDIWELRGEIRNNRQAAVELAKGQSKFIIFGLPGRRTKWQISAEAADHQPCRPTLLLAAAMSVMRAARG
jgi:hypothetical protein